MHSLLQQCDGDGGRVEGSAPFGATAAGGFECVESPELAPVQRSGGGAGAGAETPGLQSTLGNINACSKLAASLNAVLAKHRGGVRMPATSFGCTFTGRLISTAGSCAGDAARLNSVFAAYGSDTFACDGSGDGDNDASEGGALPESAPTAAPSTVAVGPLITTDLLLLGGSSQAPLCFGANSAHLQGVLVAPAPAVSSSFAVEVSAALQPGKTGYLIARTDSTGFRYFGLYVRSRGRGLVFFYKAVGISAQQSILFSFPGIDDGEPHAIALAVEGMTAVLRVDGVAVGPQSPRALAGLVENCGAASSDCITYLGQREGGFRMSGCLIAATISSSPVPAPSVSSTGVDLLAADADGAGSSVDGASAGARCSRPGSAANGGRQLGPLLPHQAGGRFSMLVTFAVQDRGYGYLLSKGAGGASRYYSIYLRRADRRLVFYYRAVGEERQRSVVLAPETAIEDDATYTVLVSVNGDAIYTVLRRGGASNNGSVSSSSGGRGSLGAGRIVDDCGGVRSTECTFHVGQRNGGYELRNGCISAATIYQDAVLSAIP